MLSNKSKGLFLAIFAILYFIYTAFIAEHGVHAVNSILAAALLALGGYFYFKKEGKKIVHAKKRVDKKQVDELTESQKKMRIYLVITFFVLITISIFGLIWLSTTSTKTVTLALSFAAGLSMITLPCTLPLVFIIVPLSMGKGYAKGLSMAILFSLGLIITLTLYGVFVAFAGQVFGLGKIISIMFIIAGVAALVFGLTELRLIKFKVPSYGVGVPGFIQRQGDYLKAFVMGLLLGSAGLACPNPATYIILIYIATIGNAWYGAALQAINGLGRVLPLIAFSILGILGISATGWLVRKKELVNKIMGWFLIAIGAFIFVWGIYGHLWFVNTPLHGGWTREFAAMGGTAVGEYECCIEPPCTECLNTDHCGEVGKCICRQHLEDGEPEKICGECRIGIAEGRGIFDIARRTEVPAFTIFSALILIPIFWYFWKKPYKKGSKKEDEE